MQLVDATMAKLHYHVDWHRTMTCNAAALSSWRMPGHQSVHKLQYFLDLLTFHHGPLL